MDEEALKTLKRIESLLTKSLNVSNRPGVAGGRKADTFQAQAKGMKGVDAAAQDLTSSLVGLNKQVRASRASFYALNKTMKAGASTSSNAQQSLTGPGYFTRLANTLRNALGEAGGGGRGIPRIPSLPGMSPTGLFNFVAFAGVVKALKQQFIDLTNDVYHLQARGISAADSLGTLYFQAAKAGMSLGEYVKVLETAETSLVRSKSFADFNSQISVTTDQLKTLGIFGPAATQLAVQMREAGTELGISQEDLTKANSAQLSVLEKMRTSGLMTAESFMAVVKQLQDSETVQNTLLGLAPKERAARLVQLTEMMTFGKQLGLSTEASKRLGEAFINQRNSTLGQRQESSARIMQAAAALGMNSNDANVLAQLSRKKNLTPAEQSQMLPLAGQLQQLLQSRLNDDSQPVAQGIYEEIDNMLSSGSMKDILKASGNASLTMSSGEKANTEFAKATPDFLIGARTLLQWADGLSKNPISSAIVTGVSAGIASAGFATLFGRGIGSSLGKVLPSIFGGIKGLGGLFTSGLSNIGAGLKAAPGLFSGLGTAIATWFKGANFLSSIAPTLGKFSGALITGLSTAFKAVSSVLAPAIGAITEAWTGDINSAFGGGDWIDRINNIIFGAIRAIPASITGLIDSVFGTGITNWLDRALTMARAGFQVLINGIVDSVMSIIPDSFTPDWLKNWSKNGHDKLETMFQTMDKLMADSSQTLTTIGDKNQQVMKAQVDTATQGVAQVKAASAQMSNVIYGTDGLQANVLATARAQGTSIAMPGDTPRAVVTPPVSETTSVSTTTSTQAQVQSSTVASVLAQPGVQELLAQLVSLMQQSLSTEQTQTALTEQLVRGVTRTVFRDHETNVKQVLGGD